MRVWNASGKAIEQLYNNRNYVIGAGEVKELNDDLVVFLLSKKEIKGRGLVQLKDDDNKVERYKEARLNIYNWAKEKYSDYEKHCEEREAQSLKALLPHKEIQEYKRTIDEYEKWEIDGMPISDEISTAKDSNVVYGCPYCNKTFPSQNSLKGHLMSHQKEENVVTSTTKDEGKG